MELLLHRLGMHGATITDIEVFSRVTQQWPAERRHIEASSFPFPVDLSGLRNMQAFRYELGSASAALGRRGRTGGNPTKRLRFTLEWPFAVGRGAAELEYLLAGGSHGPSAPIGESTPPSADLEEPTDDPDELLKRARVAKDKMEEASDGLPPPPPGAHEVEERTGWSKRYVRDPNVVAWVLIVANGTCEVCNTPAPFNDMNGDPFLEVHHVRPLGEGGPDVTDNAVAACPNCHRRLHFGANKDAYRVATIAKIGRLKDYPAAEVLPVSWTPS